MTPEEKIGFLRRRNELRPSCKANTPHITLSFDPSEKISDEKLTAIVTVFMESIGFGDQPYLVYAHLDTHHPHLHVVSTLIRADGSRIPTHLIGKKKCEPARQRIEEQFDLVRAKGRRKKQQNVDGQGRMRKLTYGQSDTYRSIAETVQMVMDQYIFTTIGEFNAILRQANLFAETGRKGTKTANNGGLYYRVLDADGKPKGVPIKASELPGKPTLKALQAKFMLNRPLQEEHLKSIRIRVEWALRKKPKDMESLVELLDREQLKMIIWKNASGWAYGVTFLDLKTKTAVNGRALGREMGITALQTRIDYPDQNNSRGPHSHTSDPPSKEFHPSAGSGGLPYQSRGESVVEQLIELLLQPVQSDDRIPFEFSAKKKKKKYRPKN